MVDERSLDIIREVINYGIGDAANSLSQLVSARVIIRMPDVRILDALAIDEYTQNLPTSEGICISQGFKGAGWGKTGLFYTNQSAASLLKAISGQVTEASALTVTDVAAFNEIGNIIMGSCLVGIGNLTDTRITFELPEAVLGVSEKYFQNLFGDLGKSDKLIVANNEMRIKETDIHGILVILLSFEDFRQITDNLEKRMK